MRHGQQKENKIKEEEIGNMNRQWASYLRRHNVAGAVTRRAVVPVFESWYTRSWGYMSYRITQIMTGHGSFGAYLHRIRRARSPMCAFCPAGVVDDSVHTLENCSAWDVQRARLSEELGVRTVSLRVVVRTICES